MMAAEEVRVEESVADSGVIPSDETIRSKWANDLADMYSSRARLASTIRSAELRIEAGEDGKTVVFLVQNEAQRDWIETNQLHQMEGNFRQILASSKIYLKVEAAEVIQTTIYTSDEKTKAVASENPDVAELVRTFGLEPK